MYCTNCLPQSQNLKFCLLLWILPFLTTELEPHLREDSDVYDMTEKDCFQTLYSKVFIVTN